MTRPPADPTPNARRRAIRVEVGHDARSYVSDGQRVTLVPLTIKRRHNRKLLIPPTPESAAQAAGGVEAPMIKSSARPSTGSGCSTRGVTPRRPSLRGR